MDFSLFPFELGYFFLGALVTRHWFLAQDLMAWIGLSITLILSVIVLSLETYFIEPWRVRYAERRT
jgi:hypothetical protein